MYTDQTGNQTSAAHAPSEAGERFERVVQVSEPVNMTARSFVPWLFGGFLALLALAFFVFTVIEKINSQNLAAYLTKQNSQISEQLKGAEESLVQQRADVASKTKEIEDLSVKLKFEREARALDSKELAEARKQKAEIEANIAARDLAVRERDAARKVSLEVTASKQALEEQVSVLQKRLDDALARITDLEEQIRKALAERDEMQDMLRVCQARHEQAAQAAVVATQPIPAAADQPVAAVTSARSSVEHGEGFSAPATPSSINTPPIGPGAVTNVLLLPGDDTDGNQNIVRQVNELTVSREEARKRTEVLEDEVSRLRAEMLKNRGVKASTTGLKLAPSDRLRPTSVGNNYAQKEIGLVGFLPDAVGNIIVGIGEGLDSLFTGTHYVPRELIQSGDAHGG